MKEEQGWRNFFEEKPPAGNEVLFVIYDTYYLGHYSVRPYLAKGDTIFSDVGTLDADEIEDERERGIYWMPLPPWPTKEEKKC